MLARNMTDYEATCRSFKLTVPERFNFAVEVIGKWAQDPKKIAMLWVGHDGTERSITFRDFQERSDRLANVLEGLGVKPGESIFVMLPRVVEWWEIILATMKARAVSVPGTTMLTTKDLHYRLASADAVVAVTDVQDANKVLSVRADCPALRHLVVVGEERGDWLNYEDLMQRASSKFSARVTGSHEPCMIYFTSGTTGLPKMVLNTHASYPIGHIITGKFWLDLTPDDLHWTISDTGWAQAAWTNVYAPWNMGAALLIHDGRGKFDPLRSLQVLDRYPITTFFAPPTVYRMLILEDLRKYRFSLRHCVGAGEPLNPEIIETWREGTGLTVYEGYGQTETVLTVGTFQAIEVRPGSMGRAAPGFSVAVVNEDGHVLPPGEEGDLGLRVRPDRPVGLFQEYWKDPEATSRCYRGDWYISGDRASMDEDGYFWFVGRADDVIISSGYRIGPFEVESALLEHSAVAEAAVIDVPDEMRSRVVKAFVCLTPGFRPSRKLVQELQEHVKSVTAPYKYPRVIDFVDELPKTISGKIRRVELRKQEAERKARD